MSGACHLSTGDVFRAAGGRDACEQTPSMEAAIKYMRRGALVPDATVWEMVRERSSCLCCGGGLHSGRLPAHIGRARVTERVHGKRKTSAQRPSELRIVLG